MPKNNAVDDFLSEVKGDNESFLQQDPDPFEGVTVQQKKEGGNDDEGADDEGNGSKEKKPTSFHQDPKVKRYIEKEVARLTQHLTPREAEKVREQMNDGKPDVVAAFAAIIGNDTPEKVAALQMLGQTIGDLKADANSARQEIEAGRKAEREAREALDKGFEDIEDEFDVDLTSNTPQSRKTRGEFIDFVKRVAPKNAQGEITDYPDFRETFTLFQQLKSKPASTNRAKELAARGMERSGDASEIPKPVDQSWKGVEKFFSTLKG